MPRFGEEGSIAGGEGGDAVLERRNRREVGGFARAEGAEGQGEGFALVRIALDGIEIPLVSNDLERAEKREWENQRRAALQARG